MSKIESASTAQGAVHKINDLTFDRRSLNAKIKAENEQLMDYIETVGETLIYDRDNKPKMYSVQYKTRTRLNKKNLAEHVGLKARDLTVTKIAELVNEKKLDADTIASFEEHDRVRRLKKRRANKEEIKRFAEVK